MYEYALYALLIYLTIVNIIAFAMMGTDKRNAKLKRRRIPEKRMFLTGAAGGAFGIWCGMKAWRHKTQHRSFVVGIPFLLALNLVVLLTAGGWLAIQAFDFPA